MQEKNISKLINVLWTGGYDSSFRIVQLSKNKVTIQPYYLSDNRKCEKNELKAISEITLDINKNLETKCTILPLIIYKVSEVKPDKEITDAYNNLRKIVPIGSQYEWLARFAKEKGLRGLELGIEKAASSQVVTIFNKLQIELQLVGDGDCAYYKIHESSSNSDLIKIFGQFHYPSDLYNMTKTEMLIEYKRLGFEDTVVKTWFCHRPIRNQPCGLCGPCKSTLSEGMKFRFPRSSLIRNKFKIFYNIKPSVGKALRRLNLR